MTTKSNHVVKKSAIQALWPLRPRQLLLILVLVLVLWAGLKTWRVGQAVRSLLAQQENAQAIMANGLAQVDPDEAQVMVHTVRQDFVRLRDETAFLMPLMPHLGWVPEVGPLLVAAPHLVTMGDAGTETAVYAVDSLLPLLSILQADANNDQQLPQLINALASARPGLAQAALSLERVVSARGNIASVAQFPERIQPLFAQMDEWLPIAQDSLAIAQILPDIMGQNGRRTYLLLAQNEDEIRATGGFISGVGTLTLENGDIQNLDFQDANSFDLPALLENSASYDFPPQPLHELMGSDYFLLRDANYWPDFPYSAQQAMELYQRVKPEVQLDGVIAIDQQFMSLLVAATGPVTVPGTGEKITAQNTVASFRSAFNIEEGQDLKDWLENRKSFLTTFSAAILAKIQGDFGSVDPVTFIKNIHSALNRRHLQIYLLNPQETAVLDQLNWDGRLENPTGQDFLFVADTNMGFNKTNMHIQRTFAYDIALDPQSSSRATVTLTYSHTNPPGDDLPCVQGISYAQAPTYQEIADRCYFNYLRLYTPADTTLLQATSHAIPAEMLVGQTAWNKPAETVTEFASFTTFANFMMVPRGERLTTEIAYLLPPAILQPSGDGYLYQLWLRKQPGTGSEAGMISIALPEGFSATQVSASTHATIVNQGNRIEVQLDLQTDTLITVQIED